MTDKELLDMLDRYLVDNDVSIGDFFDQLGIARANYSRWRNGRKISTAMRKKITTGIMPAIATSACFLPHCPAEPPVDRLTQYLLEAWQGMTGEEKARVIALIEDIKDKKEKTVAGVDTTVCQTKLA